MSRGLIILLVILSAILLALVAISRVDTTVAPVEVQKDVAPATAPAPAR